MHDLWVLGWLIGAGVGLAVGWWAVCHLLAWLSGWSSLRARFLHPTPDAVVWRDSGSGRIGRHHLPRVSYNGVLWCHVDADALSLSVMPLFSPGHPPVRVPWSAITSVTERTFLWMPIVQVDVAEAAVIVALHGELAQAVRAARPTAAT